MWKRLFGAAAVDRTDHHRIREIALTLLPSGTSVSVNEIFCNDPGCEGIETVILIMHPARRTTATKIAKYAKDVEASDIAEALSGNMG